MPDTPLLPDPGVAEEPTPQPTDLADEPHTQAPENGDQLGKSESQEEDSLRPTTATPRDEGEEVSEKTGTHAALASLEQAVAELTALLREVKAKAAPAPEAAASPRKEDDLTAELRQLRTAIQAQGNRIAQLEKRAGLPNSAPVEKSTAPAEPADVGWPLDLNQSLDRSTVDKAVSFHDL